MTYHDGEHKLRLAVLDIISIYQYSTTGIEFEKSVSAGLFSKDCFFPASNAISHNPISLLLAINFTFLSWRANLNPCRGAWKKREIEEVEEPTN